MGRPELWDLGEELEYLSQAYVPLEDVSLESSSPRPCEEWVNSHLEELGL